MKKIVVILIFIFSASVFSNENTDIDTNTAENTKLKETLYNLFKKQEEYAKERSFENSVLFSPYIIKRQHTFGNDLFNWTDVLQQNPNFVSVRYSPDFPMNRALFRGYLIPTESHFLDQLYSPTLPMYYRDLLEVKEIEILPDGTISSQQFNEKTITPDVFFAWQGGLFDGNMLKFRMLRNLSKTLSFNAFVSYSDLKRMSYYHDGGMAQTYLTYYNDSSRTSIDGYNPYSLVNKSGVELNYKSKISANLRYSYSDIRQDLAYHTDSTMRNDTLTFSNSIAYNEHNAFLHQLNGSFEIPFGERFLLRNLGKLESVYQRENPVSRTVNGNFATESSQQNNTLQSAGTQFFFAPIPNDSISIQVAANRYVSDTSNARNIVSHHTKVLFENKFISPNSDKIIVTANGGIEFLRTNGMKVKEYPTYSIDSDFKFGNFNTQLYSKLSTIPATYDYTTKKESSFPDNIFNVYENYIMHGINLHYQFPIASIHGGYSYLYGGNSYWLGRQFEPRFWRNSTSYFQPRHVFSTGFSLGEVGPVSMFSNWFFSDELPTFKSYSGLRFHFNRNSQVRHFYADITYNYWSKRDRHLGIVYYWPEDHQGRLWGYMGNNPHWNRSIHDISFKLSAEIETFRVFWKIDNFLNRTNSYVPGYIMPGLIFRWGFSWNIMG